MWTVSIDVANRFCGDDGVILEMQPVPGAYELCFNVEWISCFAYEKERVFAHAEGLGIINIKYYARGKWQNNQPYLRAFNLFSCLFGGHYISPLLRAGNRKRQKPWKVLLNLITVYKANNNIGSLSFHDNSRNIKSPQDGVSNLCIPLYVQQLFYRLLDHFQQNQGGKYLIESEYELLDRSLQNELLVLASNDSKDEESGKMTINKSQLSPLMKHLCCNGDIILMKQYIWVIDEPKVKEMRDANQHESLCSDIQYFKLSPSESVSFVIGLFVNSGGTEWCAPQFKIKDTPIAVDGRVSFIIDELGVYLNNQTLDSAGKSGGANKWLFKHSLLRNRPNVNTLTVRSAVYLTSST